MKILVVTQYYYPEQFRVNDICKELVERGHSVTVLTGLPNYPKGEIFEEYKNSNRMNEIIDGVNIVRCSNRPRKKGVLNLALNYLSFAIKGTLKVDDFKEKFDFIFVYQLSPITMAFPAIRMKKKKKLPMFLYCCDIWPASILDINIKRNGILYNCVKKMSSYIYGQCDEVIVTSPSFIKYLNNVCKVDDSKISFIPQHAEDIYSLDIKTEDNGIIDFMFLGNIGISQNCSCIIKAVKKINSKLPFKVHFVGDGSCLNEIKQLVQKEHLEEKIKFYGFQTIDKLPKYYKLADVCILTLNNKTEIGDTIPAKLQGYMAAAKPVVASISGDAAIIIKDANCGYQVEANDVDGLAYMMNKFILHPELIDELGKNGRNYFETHFTKKVVVDMLEEKIMKGIKNENPDD